MNVRGMQVNPELWSAIVQDDDRVAVAPELLELGRNMERAQAKMTTREGFTEDESSSISTDPINGNDSFSVLRDFVSCTILNATSRGLNDLANQIQTHSHFANRYQKAELAVSAVLAALEDDAVYFKSTFDRKTVSRSKSRTHSQGMFCPRDVNPIAFR